ncbi:MAG TPA: hypothetical protein PLE85_11455, partial [Bacteroidales bacterium]|nr:hypothetical protein [Bacteroidales bacterium]
MMKTTTLSCVFLMMAMTLSVTLPDRLQAQPQYALLHSSTSNNVFPFNSTTNQRQWVYYPSDFPGAPSGFITTIYIRASAVVSPNFTNLTIMMGNTTLNTLSTGPWPLAGMDTVLFAPSFSTSSLTNNWIAFPLQTPFFYTGTSNFLVLASQGGYSPGFSVPQGTETARSLYGTSTSPTGTIQDRLADFGFDLMPITAPNDAGIWAFTSPQSPALPGNETVKVLLRNFGTDTLNSATVNWSVNGIAQTSVPWTGMLMPQGDTATVTLGTYNFPLGAHTIKSWSTLPNSVADTINQNDTASMSLYVCNLLSGVYTVGDTTADYLTISDAVGAVGACGV